MRARLGALLAAVAFTASAQQSPDVPFVGTPPVVVAAMLDMAQVTPADVVLDLGSGDGRLVIAAAQRGARGIGVDLNGSLVSEARRRAERAGVAARAQFETGNLYVTDLARANVLTLYLYPRVNLELRPRILAELRPGSRVVSHEFDMGAWTPDETRQLAVADKPYGPPVSPVHLWIVPAHAAGRWRWGDMDLVLDQRFQRLTARVAAGAAYRIEDLTLHGDELAFTLVAGEERARHAGRINGDRISGTVADRRGTAPWTATRIERGTMDIEG